MSRTWKLIILIGSLLISIVLIAQFFFGLKLLNLSSQESILSLLSIFILSLIYLNQANTQEKQYNLELFKERYIVYNKFKEINDKMSHAIFKIEVSHTEEELTNFIKNIREHGEALEKLISLLDDEISILFNNNELTKEIEKLKDKSIKYQEKAVYFRKCCDDKIQKDIIETYNNISDIISDITEHSFVIKDLFREIIRIKN